MTVLRAGVIGLGMMGQNHVRILRALKGVELVGVQDPLGDYRGVAEGVHCCRELDEFLELGIDAAVLATPTDDHLPVGLELARAGVHVLIEKPLGTDVAAGERLVSAFDSAGVVAAVGHVERFNPAVRAMKSRLEAGELGETYQVATSRQGPFPNRIRDVGVIKDLATHDIDLTAWVVDRRFESVAACAAHRAGRPHEDLVAVVGTLEGGVVTNHLVNWLTPTKDRRATVTGDRGTFVADMLTADLTFFANATTPAEWDALSRFRGVSEGDMIRYAIPKPEPLVSELEGFRDWVNGRGGEIVSASEGLETLRVADAIARSSACGTVETLR